MMDAIGGYFELADRECGKFPHSKGVLRNTGRNALEYILREIPDIRGIWIPYYTCEVVLEPIRKLNIPFYFYHVNTLFEIVENIQLNDGQYLIANNYFGIKDAYIKHLYNCYGERLIVDCAQSFFFMPLPGMKAFYSCRKFVGVADGGVAYGVEDKSALSYELDDSEMHDDHLFLRKSYGAEVGFQAYQANERKLDNQAIRRMSASTLDILNHIDYEKIMGQRKKNFEYLFSVLRDKNLLQLLEQDDFACPMIFPYLDAEGYARREELIANKIFVAKYWKNVSNYYEYEYEVMLANNMIPLPIDQRYGMNEMVRVSTIINK